MREKEGNEEGGGDWKREGEGRRYGWKGMGEKRERRKVEEGKGV